MYADVSKGQIGTSRDSEMKVNKTASNSVWDILCRPPN